MASSTVGTFHSFKPSRALLFLNVLWFEIPLVSSGRWDCARSLLSLPFLRFRWQRRSSGVIRASAVMVGVRRKRSLAICVPIMFHRHAQKKRRQHETKNALFFRSQNDALSQRTEQRRKMLQFGA